MSSSRAPEAGAVSLEVQGGRGAVGHHGGCRASSWSMARANASVQERYAFMPSCSMELLANGTGWDREECC